MVSIREIIPFYGLKIQVSEILFHLPRLMVGNEFTMFIHVYRSFFGEWWWFTGVLGIDLPSWYLMLDIWCWCVCFNLFMKLHSNDIQRAMLSSSGSSVAMWQAHSTSETLAASRISGDKLRSGWSSGYCSAMDVPKWPWLSIKDDFLYKSLWTSMDIQ